MQTGRNYVRVFLEANARADDGMELERFETLRRRHAWRGWRSDADDGARRRHHHRRPARRCGGRRSPIRTSVPPSSKGASAGVFFHEIFGHRVEGHRQKNEDEGQTFAKKIGEPIMPAFVSVYDDPTLARLGNVDLNGFYRFDDEGRRRAAGDAGLGRRAEGLPAQPLADARLLASRTATGGGRRAGRSCRARGTWSSSRSASCRSTELRDLLREEAAPAGEAVRAFVPRHLRRLHQHGSAADRRRSRCCRSWSTGSGSTAVPTSWCAASIWSARRWRRCRGSWPPPTTIRSFNGYCGAESGFVPVSATSPSLLVQQIEVERRDKGNDKPPVLPRAGADRRNATDEADDALDRARWPCARRWSRAPASTRAPTRSRSPPAAPTPRAHQPARPSGRRCRTSSRDRWRISASATSRARITSPTRCPIWIRRPPAPRWAR